MNSAKRSPAADLIRILAFFFVVSVHFFLHSGFYNQIVVGKRMLAMVLLRSFFMICVPLFLVLSGYLLRRKTIEKSYYKRIGKILITYLLASLLCAFYYIVFLDKDFTVKDVILKILDYTAAPYSWYIEMYLGLFLLIPFLNTAYNALPSQKSKIWLIITFVILTGLPSVLNIYDLKTLDFSALPSSSTTMNQLIPDSWQDFYPLTYYFIGCYLSEYGLKIKKELNILLIILFTMLSGNFSYWRSYKVTFIMGDWCDFRSLFNMILTTLVFALLINADYSKIPKGLAKFMQKISGLCLGAYLVSWVFDHALYGILCEKVPSVPDRFVYYIIMVPTVFILSLLTSYLLSILQSLIEKTFSLLCRSLRKVD